MTSSDRRKDEEAERKPIRTLADLNKRNAEIHKPVPLPERRGDGSLVDHRYPRRDDGR